MNLPNSGIIFIYSGPTNLPPEVVKLMERGLARRSPAEPDDGGMLKPLPDKVDESWLPSPVRQIKVNLLDNRVSSRGPTKINVIARNPPLAETKQSYFQGDCHTPRLRSGFAMREPALPPTANSRLRRLGYAFVALSLGGILAPFNQQLRLEANYLVNKIAKSTIQRFNPTSPGRAGLRGAGNLPPSTPVIFDPLVTPDGASINPINTEFSVIVPKIGINAPVIPGVDPGNPGKYMEALEKGVAHASTSYFPDENGTVYLFSHSTNYDWFVKDLNAVFYLLKNLESGDLIVVYYKNVRYTYKLREKQVVKPNAISYLAPQLGAKNLILQTCWPPGSVSERLLIFADLIDESGLQI